MERGDAIMSECGDTTRWLPYENGILHCKKKVRERTVRTDCNPQELRH